MSLHKMYPKVVKLFQPHILPDTQGAEIVLASIPLPVYPGTDMGWHCSWHRRLPHSSTHEHHGVSSAGLRL